VDEYIIDSCSLHYQFANIKLPMPIFSADRNAWWLQTYDINDIHEDLYHRMPAF
jgi:hypothetical protein